MKSILITGASSGIGAATAMELSGPEQSLILVARSKEKLQVVADQVRANGGSANVVPADLEDLDQVESLANEFATGYPVLINCAGVGVFANYADLSWEDVERQFRLNLLAPARLIHASLPTMLERGGGQIVNVLSMAAIHILPGANAYSASKAALLTLAKTISQEYRSQGVRVTNLLPGATDTSIWDGSPMESRKPEMIPTEDVASLIGKIVRSPDSYNIDEILMMPPKGVL
jgi:short-subunit dehydrogenase